MKNYRLITVIFLILFLGGGGFNLFRELYLQKQDLLKEQKAVSVIFPEAIPNMRAGIDVTIPNNWSASRWVSLRASRNSSNKLVCPVNVESVPNATGMDAGIDAIGAVWLNRNMFEPGHQTSPAPDFSICRQSSGESPTPCTRTVLLCKPPNS